MDKGRLMPYLLSSVSGVMVICSMPYYNQFVLAWWGFVPLLLPLRGLVWANDGDPVPYTALAERRLPAKQHL